MSGGKHRGAVWIAAGACAVVGCGLLLWAAGDGGGPAPAPVAVLAVKPPVVSPSPAVLSVAPVLSGPPVAPSAPPSGPFPVPSLSSPEPPAAATEPEPGYPYTPEPAPETTMPPPVASATPVFPQPPAHHGAPPWIVNAAPGQAVPGRPAVAIVIDDMGLDRKRSARAVRLPGPLTLSWLPYAEDLPAQTAAARAAGHELMVHLPMEPSVPANPGPDALLTGLAPAEIMRRLERALGRFPGFVGVNNHMGSRFTADRGVMRPVLAEIARRGLLWLDSRTTPATVGMAVAAELHMPWAGRDVFLDHVMFPAEVKKALTQLETAAKRTGMAVAIGHPHDVTLDALAAWLPDLHRRGLTLVPLSAIVRAQHPVQLQQAGERR